MASCTLRMQLAGGVAVAVLALAIGAAHACGGSGAGGVAGVAAAIGSGNTSASAAAAAAGAVAQQATAAAGSTVGVSVAGISAAPSTVSMSVDVTVGEGDWKRTFRRFVVLPIEPQAARTNPNALAVALSATVGRMLIEDVAQKLSGNAALAESVRKAADRVTKLTEADFNLTPG